MKKLFDQVLMPLVSVVGEEKMSPSCLLFSAVKSYLRLVVCNFFNGREGNMV